MKYRHHFHAGNFADVHKHATLVALMRALARKEKGFLYLDTHGGRGIYELAGERGGGEAAQGITRLIAAAPQAPELRDYLSVFESFRGPGGRLEYPGSPAIAGRLLREQDRGIVFETEPSEITALRRAIDFAPQLRVVHGDGYAAAREQLPPHERRALLLVDPPFEDPTQEFRHIATLVQDALQRLQSCVIAIWYPIKDQRSAPRPLRALATATARPALFSELWVHPRDSRVGLNGSGLWIVNPPYRLDADLHRWLPELAQALDQGGGGCELRATSAPS